jgi:hypothetical protein
MGASWHPGNLRSNPAVACKQLKIIALILMNLINGEELGKWLKTCTYQNRTTNRGILQGHSKFGKYLGEGTSRGEQLRAAPLKIPTRMQTKVV